MLMERHGVMEAQKSKSPRESEIIAGRNRGADHKEIHVIKRCKEIICLSLGFIIVHKYITSINTTPLKIIMKTICKIFDYVQEMDTFLDIYRLPDLKKKARNRKPELADHK